MSNSAETQKTWMTQIKPKRGWFDINITELWNYRDLIVLLVRRDFVSVYKQTILGPLWFVIQPVMTTLVFTVVFGRIAKLPTDGLPPFLFYMAGLVPWTYFASCLNNTSSTFTNNASIFGKVYFPRLAIPAATVINNIFTFVLQLILFILFMIYFGMKGVDINPNIWVFVIPLLLIQLAALGLGVGILVSSLTTRYRDLTFTVGFGVQLWMYATPIIYPASLVPEKWQPYLAINPMYSVIETFRYAFLGAGQININYLIVSFVVTGIILFLGILIFNRVEKSFMDTV